MSRATEQANMHCRRPARDQLRDRTERRISRDSRGQRSSRSATGISEPERPDRCSYVCQGLLFFIPEIGKIGVC
jgi:hypothetical protein